MCHCDHSSHAHVRYEWVAVTTLLMTVSDMDDLVFVEVVHLVSVSDVNVSCYLLFFLVCFDLEIGGVSK